MKMLKPLSQWICDTCGGVIKSPAEGWVGFLKDKDSKAHDFRIVHHVMFSPLSPSGNCYPYNNGANRASMRLKWLTGDTGIAYLFHLIDSYGVKEVDVREFGEFMRRLVIPYYEEAREYLGHAVEDGYFHNQTELVKSSSNDFRKVIEKYTTQTTAL
jgi:hypothetical protein